MYSVSNTLTHSTYYCTKISPSLARRFSNCPRGKGFVKISATISCVGQYLSSIVLSQLNIDMLRPLVRNRVF